MRTITLIANHKLHGNSAFVTSFASSVGNALAQMPENICALYCPPAPYLSLAKDTSKNSRLQIAAQTLSQQTSGAHTGSVAASMLADIGVFYCLVGHSEVRAREQLSNADVATAASRAIEQGITPIICVGESEAEHASGQTAEVLSKQVASLEEVLSTGNPLMIAYEPVWAIGSGRTPSSAEICEAHRHIRACVHSMKEARDTHISLLYGGSVKPNNLNDILAIAGVDGALIGSASLVVEDFNAMLQQAVTLLKG